MKRAFVGFSTPIGYSYRLQTPKTRNDSFDSPNPVLYGSIGLLTLYDEIWFACESLCPSSMRGLPYVKYFDVERPHLRLDEMDFVARAADAAEEVKAFNSVNLSDIFGGRFGAGMTKYLGGEYATDNHTHGLDFLGVQVGGNPGFRELAYDLWLLDRNKDLKLDLTLNPLTARIAFQLPDRELARQGIERLSTLALAEAVLTFGSFYDITGPQGPYHPAVEEIRQDPLIQSFRGWMDGQRTRLDNRELRDIQADVDARVRDLTRRSLRAHVEPERLSNVVIKITKDELLGKIPGLSAAGTIADAVAQNRRAEEEGWAAFIALTRDTIANSGDGSRE